jgi:hypothetical protein
LRALNNYPQTQGSKEPDCFSLNCRVADKEQKMDVKAIQLDLSRRISAFLLNLLQQKLDEWLLEFDHGEG